MDSKSAKPTRVNKKIYEKKLDDVYSDALLTEVLEIPMNAVGSGIKDKLEKKLRATIEGKCISEGYIKLDDVYSTALLTHVLEIPMNAVGSGIKDKLVL